MRSVKRNVRRLLPIAMLIMVMQLVYDFYLVLPSVPVEGAASAWMGIVLAVGLGGIWFACLLWQLGRRPLLPSYDFNQNETLRLRRKQELEELHVEVATHG